MTVFKNLIGKRINGIFLGNDAWTVVFRTTDGLYFRYNTGNDCCNTVWVNHINGVDAVGKGNSFDLLRGALVLSAEDKDWVQQDDEDAYEVIEDVCFTLCTDRGYIDIEVRNSHNGYYGGTFTEDEDVNLHEIDNLTQVVEDF